MRLLPALAFMAVASTAAAQTTPSSGGFGRAPWWMDKPIIASTGNVWTEVASNRASMTATYQAIDSDSAAATRTANEKVRALGQALAAYGADKVRVETTFSIQPLYAQYRDRQGQLNENERADKVERYQVSANVEVEVRDIRFAERVYATLMAAKPSATTPVSFRLDADNETRTQMSKLAVEDARRRALLAVEAAGTRLGAVRLIDPTGRACSTDVLITGADRSYDDTPAHQVAPPPPPPPPPAAPSFEEVVVTAQRAARGAGLRPEDIQMPLNPPLQRLESRACVIFSLG
jgi:uncharacterized protein YggE